MTKFGDYLNEGLTVWSRHWVPWIGPTVIFFLITIVATLLCFFPILFVQGPLLVGMSACALRTHQEGILNGRDIARSGGNLGPSIGAGFLLMLATGVPLLILYALMFVPLLVIGESGNGSESGLAVAGFFLLMMIQFVGMFAYMAFSLWFGTRSMFVFMILADRPEVGTMEAFRMSWAETRTRFWELLLTLFVAYVIGSAGGILCYVGAIITMPIAFSIVAAAYLDRFPREVESVEATQDAQV